jgi:hypothetical protein
MRNERGFALVVVLAMCLLVMIIGTTAIKMSELGYMAYGSERRYQIAANAAEYALNAGMSHIIANAACPGTGNCSGTYTSGGVNASYNCFSITSGNMCFIHGKGTLGGATVVKTTVVPAALPSPLAALVFRDGGKLGVGGSSTIGSCSSTCKTPGILYGGTLTNAISEFNTGEVCAGQNPDKGVYGQPNPIQNKDGTACTTTNGNCTAPTLSDRVPVLFDSTNWADLKSDFSGTYAGHAVDVPNLTVSGTPSLSSLPTVTADCTCACNVTLTSALNNCCTGTAAKTNINSCTSLKVDGTLTISGGVPASMNNIVSTGDVGVSGVTATTGNLSNKSIYALGSAGVTLNDDDITLNNTNIVAGGTVAVTSVNTITNSHVVSEGAGGITIKTEGAITGSVFATTNASGSIVHTAGGMTGSTIVSKNDFKLDAAGGSATDTALTNSYVYAKTITVNNHPGGVAGGILYSEGNFTFPSTFSGATQFGSEANPFLMLVGGDLIMDHTTGTVNFYGLLFTNGYVTTRGTGNWSIEGALIANSDNPSSTLTAAEKNKIDLGGTPAIYFRPDVLQTLKANIGTKMNAVNCSGTSGRTGFVANTKVIVY